MLEEFLPKVLADTEERDSRAGGRRELAQLGKPAAGPDRGGRGRRSPPRHGHLSLSRPGQLRLALSPGATQTSERAPHREAGAEPFRRGRPAQRASPPSVRPAAVGASAATVSVARATTQSTAASLSLTLSKSPTVARRTAGCRLPPRCWPGLSLGQPVGPAAEAGPGHQAVDQHGGPRELGSSGGTAPHRGLSQDPRGSQTTGRGQREWEKLRGSVCKEGALPAPHTQTHRGSGTVRKLSLVLLGVGLGYEV